MGAVNEYVTMPAEDAKSGFSKIFYGFGDNPDNLPQLHDDTKTAKVQGDGDLQPLAYGRVRLSGWKYGLINALPYFTNCVFRHDVFGQFRDMLEQRQLAVIERFTPDQTQIGGQDYLPPVSVAFIKTVSDPLGETARKETFEPTDFSEISENVGGNIRGLWNNQCNTDPYARVQRPYFDVDPIMPSNANPLLARSVQVYQADILNNLNNLAGINFNVS